MHSALDVSIYRFSNDGPQLLDTNCESLKIMAQLVTLLLHRKFYYDKVNISIAQHLVVACSFCCDIFLCSFLKFCRDISWQCHDIVLLRLFGLCHEKSFLVLRQFLNTLQLEYLNSMSRQQILCHD